MRSWLERYNFVYVILFLTTGLIIFQLFSKQVLNHQTYAEAAKDQSISSTTVQGARGKIMVQDKNGNLSDLAVSEWRYELSADPHQISDKKAVASSLAQIVTSLKDTDILQSINKDKIYVLLAKDIDSNTADKIRAARLAGIFLKPVMGRFYPGGEKLAAQIIGFVGADGDGKYGVEASRDNELRGTNGNDVNRIDSLGHLIDVLNSNTPKDGSDVVLTIDQNVEFEVEARLKAAVGTYQADSGSVVIMEPKSGKVLAMAGYPSFDPNNFSTVKPEDYARFSASAVSDAYEPGSVFKPIVMASAFDDGTVTPDTTNVFSGEAKVLDRTITNSDNKVNGKENMSQVIENSDNVAMAWLGGKMGKDKLRSYLDKFGFGNNTGIDLAGEESGNLWPIKDWNDVLVATSAFGQGISVTPIQLATGYCVLANGGKLVTPHVTDRIVTGDKVDTLSFPDRGQVVKKEVTDQIKIILQRVVDNGHGKKAAVEGVKVGGKTGTAEVPNPLGGYYTDRHIGTFAGFFPIDDPKIVMVVRLNNPKAVKYAESSAAPTFGEIASWLANYYQMR